MKNVVLLFTALLGGLFTINASNATAEKFNNHTFGYGNTFIFVENGITFSVFPNGEFDFYVENTPYVTTNTHLNNVNISFNAGYNYNHCLQYDDYGAVIQIRNTPIFYDFYGRVSQIGTINLHYINGRVAQIGRLYLFYNPYGAYSHCNGFINSYNSVYVYRPLYRYFVKPVSQFCMVSYKPYRKYYTPIRYSYYKPYQNNKRICYAAVGNTYHFKQNHPRKAIYYNDKRVVEKSGYPAYSHEVSKGNYVDTRKDIYSKSATKKYDASNKPSYRKNTEYQRQSSPKSHDKPPYRTTPQKESKPTRAASENKGKATAKQEGRSSKG
jgi:hypothetical protein